MVIQLLFYVNFFIYNDLWEVNRGILFLNKSVYVSFKIMLQYNKYWFI